MTTSAEQLAIALMAEARRLYNGGDLVTHLELADRLSEWATAARKIGVQHFTETSRLNRMLGEARNEVNALEGKFDDIYSICTKPGHAFAVRRIREVLDRE